jgi:hypothetical protein
MSSLHLNASGAFTTAHPCCTSALHRTTADDDFVSSLDCMSAWHHFKPLTHIRTALRPRMPLIHLNATFITAHPSCKSPLHVTAESHCIAHRE